MSLLLRVDGQDTPNCIKGWGRENGAEVLANYTEVKTVTDGETVNISIGRWTTARWTA